MTIAPPTGTVKGVFGDQLPRREDTSIELPSQGESLARTRRERAIAFLDAHLNVGRAYFVDVDAEPGTVIITTAGRDGDVTELRTHREDFGQALQPLLNRRLEPQGPTE